MESGEPSTQIKHPTDESLINSYDFTYIFPATTNFSSVPYGFLLFTSLQSKSIMQIFPYLIANIPKSLTHEPSLAAIVPISLMLPSLSASRLVTRRSS